MIRRAPHMTGTLSQTDLSLRAWSVWPKGRPAGVNSNEASPTKLEQDFSAVLEPLEALGSGFSTAMKACKRRLPAPGRGGRVWVGAFVESWWGAPDILGLASPHLVPSHTDSQAIPVVAVLAGLVAYALRALQQRATCQHCSQPTAV